LKLDLLQLLERKDEKCVSIRWQRMLQNSEGKYFMVSHLVVVRHFFKGIAGTTKLCAINNAKSNIINIKNNIHFAKFFVQIANASK